MKSKKYLKSVVSARAFLRHRDFLTYGSQLVPEELGSESWAMGWAYIRRIDDIIDDPRRTREEVKNILDQEAEIVRLALSNEYTYSSGEPIRYLWVESFANNVYNYYDDETRRIIWDLYESAVMDMQRKGRILSVKQMKRLLNKKAVKFLQLYFKLGNFNLGKYGDRIAECLGLALGMLDDLVDFVTDLKSGYINITMEELQELGINVQPTSPQFVQKLLESPFFEKKSAEILKLLLKTRRLASYLRDSPIKSLIFRLTEILARPILSGKPLPGQRYMFRFGKILNSILPENEIAAYKVGHRIMKYALKFPQMNPRLFKSIVVRILK
ncbi:MAG: hypothetical protein ACP6IP_04775 [Candidatus Njordarchaeia archaeon]